MDYDTTERRLIGASLGTLASVALAAWLVALRGALNAPLLALVVAVVVFVAARYGGRLAGTCAAAAAAMSLDFFEVRPYGTLKSPAHLGAAVTAILAIAVIAGARATRRHVGVRLVVHPCNELHTEPKTSGSTFATWLERLVLRLRGDTPAGGRRRAGPLARELGSARTVCRAGSPVPPPRGGGSAGAGVDASARGLDPGAIG